MLRIKSFSGAICAPVCVVLVVIMGCCTASLGATASFQAIDLPSGAAYALARGVSDDGTTVVGTGFVWKNGVTTSMANSPNDISGDGNVIVGGTATSTSSGNAFRLVNGVMTNLGGSHASATSYDGSVIVGSSHSLQACDWAGSLHYWRERLQKID